MPAPRINYFAAALRHPGNYLTLAVALGMAFALGSWPAAIVALLAEALFLLGVPDWSVWRGYVDRTLQDEELAEEANEIARLTANLPQSEDAEFRMLRGNLLGVERDLAQKGGSARDVLYETLIGVRKLVLKYPRLARERQEILALRALRGRTKLPEIEKQVETLREQLAGAAPTSPLRQLLAQRLRVAERRLSALGKLDSEAELRTAQMAMIRDTVLMFCEESVAPRDPNRFRIEVDSFLGELDSASTIAGELTSLEEEMTVEEQVRGARR